PSRSVSQVTCRLSDLTVGHAKPDEVGFKARVRPRPSCMHLTGQSTGFSPRGSAVSRDDLLDPISCALELHSQSAAQSSRPYNYDARLKSHHGSIAGHFWRGQNGRQLNPAPVDEVLRRSVSFIVRYPSWFMVWGRKVH